MDQAVFNSPATIAAAHPLIDIDWTVAVQFGMFLVLFFVANKLLFQPYLALRERRKAGIDGARAEAERMTVQADGKLADYEKQLAAARDRANEEGRKIRLDAATHEKQVTDQARATSQKAMDEAQANVRTETEAARLALLPQANALAKQIAGRLLGREVV